MAEVLNAGTFKPPAAWETVPDTIHQLALLFKQLGEPRDPAISQLGMPGGPGRLSLPRVPLARPPMAPNPLPEGIPPEATFTPQQLQALDDIHAALTGMYRGKRFPSTEPILPAVPYTNQPGYERAFQQFMDAKAPLGIYTSPEYNAAAARWTMAQQIYREEAAKQDILSQFSRFSREPLGGESLPAITERSIITNKLYDTLQLLLGQRARGQGSPSDLPNRLERHAAGLLPQRPDSSMFPQ